MQNEVDDFMHYCRIERRLAPLTCSAYERDVTACVRFLGEQGIGDLRSVRPPDLRRFLASEAERRPASLSALSLAAHRTPALPHGLADIWLRKRDRGQAAGARRPAMDCS